MKKEEIQSRRLLCHGFIDSQKVVVDLETLDLTARNIEFSVDFEVAM